MNDLYFRLMEFSYAVGANPEIILIFGATVVLALLLVAFT